MLLASLGVGLVVFGISKAREHRERSLDLFLAAVGLQMAGVILIVGAL